MSWYLSSWLITMTVLPRALNAGNEGRIAHAAQYSDKQRGQDHAPGVVNQEEKEFHVCTSGGNPAALNSLPM